LNSHEKRTNVKTPVFVVFLFFSRVFFFKSLFVSFSLFLLLCAVPPERLAVVSYNQTVEQVGCRPVRCWERKPEDAIPAAPE
jgi:hypothetical protein